MNEALEILDDERKKTLKRGRQPDWIEPMRATLTDDYFSDANWIYEPKWDGVRCIVIKRGKDVSLISRNRKVLNSSYPEIVEAFEKSKAGDLIIDGEIVAFRNGISSFSKLQKRMQIKDPERARKIGVKVFLYTLDLMYLDGYDLRDLDLKSRKAVLKKALKFEDPIRFTTHRNRKGVEYFRELCDKGLEGVIAKDGRSAYASTRSRLWLKFKCVNRQEFVIGGYTEPRGERIGFGALLIGFHDGGRLRYAGKVGTGFDNDLLKSLSGRMKKLERKTNPFDDEVREKNAHWIAPSLVGDVAFTEWTGDGKLRHPRFLGLREDKDPKDVIREEPENS